jgi:spore coat protein U-like protein
MKKYISLAAVAAAAVALGVSGANALTATGSLAVTANVASACSISAGATLAFGTVNAADTTTHTDGNTTIGVTCGSPFTIALDTGAKPDVNGRRQVHVGAGSDPADLIGYDLSDISSGGAAWNSARVYAAGSTSVAVYGRLDTPAAGQHTGSYSDTVGITLTY